MYADEPCGSLGKANTLKPGVSDGCIQMSEKLLGTNCKNMRIL